MTLLRFRWVALALWLGATVAAAQVKVEEAWVRATVPGQQAAGAFMKITSTEPAKLVSVASSVSKFSEIHVMKMDGGVLFGCVMPRHLCAVPARPFHGAGGGALKSPV